MAPTPRRYGSISSKDDEGGEEVELLTTGETFIGTIDTGSSEVVDEPTNIKKKQWTIHNCISYTLAAVICLLVANYWHSRADSYNDNNINEHGGDTNHRNRVPMPPALSKLDPAKDLHFQSVSRRGNTRPSNVYGDKYLNGKKFVPLPTNQWYQNLLSHKANDPSKLSETGHVYTIPYIVGVSPPPAPKFGNAKEVSTTQTMAGIELFMPVLQASSKNMQMVFDKNNGMSLGATVDNVKKGESPATSYIVDPDEDISPLGVSLKWNHVNMKTHVVRGSPYGTVRFGKDDKNKSVLPTIIAGNRPKSIIIDSDDDTSTPTKMMCGSTTGKPIEQNPSHKAPISKDGKPHIYSVKRELIIAMDESDFTWVVFFSKPVSVECYSDAMPAVSTPGADAEIQFRLNVVEVNDDDDEEEDTANNDELVVRLALLNECTTGKGIIKAHCDHLRHLSYDTVSKKSKDYLKMLRKGSMIYPKSPLVGTQFPEADDDDKDDNGRVTNVIFDWDATSVKGKASSEKAVGLRTTSQEVKTEKDPLIMFALPHHLESLSTSSDSKDDLCLHTFHGRTCIVTSDQWILSVEHKPQSFLAARPPTAEAIPLIAEALNEDIKFKISSNMLRAAADTYFPGKILSKIGRIIEINEELQNLKAGDGESNNYSDTDSTLIEEAESAAGDTSLPSNEEVESLLDDLQQGVEVWLHPGGKQNGGGEAEFLYDTSWGGFINCGCTYSFKKGHESEGTCNNTFPMCPALTDVNTNFGNGMYNDHHFHYGYHISAAAIVAKHRPQWGVKYFERILLYVRDIANPSADDEFFPMYRQKDWYLGNSFAAGLVSMELSPHGREQESSSEAIAAFEAVALFGSITMDIFSNEGDSEKLESARTVRNVGELLTSMELSAADRYWHVYGANPDEKVSSEKVNIITNLDMNMMSNSNTTTTIENHYNTYPTKYNKPAVGMLYDTMASFQTWFSNEEVVSYGIQLIPLTAVAEQRDSIEWVTKVLPVYKKACDTANKNSNFCDSNGWSIVTAALLAETGHVDDALEMASLIPKSVFKSQGGDGNSLTNTSIARHYVITNCQVGKDW